MGCVLHQTSNVLCDYSVTTVTAAMIMMMKNIKDNCDTSGNSNTCVVFKLEAFSLLDYNGT